MSTSRPGLCLAVSLSQACPWPGCAFLELTRHGGDGREESRTVERSVGPMVPTSPPGAEKGTGERRGSVDLSL